jgi:hypothetical protein
MISPASSTGAVLVAAIIVGPTQLAYGNANITLFLALLGILFLIRSVSPPSQSAMLTCLSIILGYSFLNVSFAVAALVAAVVARASMVTIGIRLANSAWLYLLETSLTNSVMIEKVGLYSVLTHERSDVWLDGFKCWLDHPWFGSPSCVRALYGEVYSHFHNTALSALAFNGPIGLILSFWFAWRIWVFGSSKGRGEISAIFLIWSMFDEPLFFTAVGALFVILLLHSPPPPNSGATQK